MIKLSKVVENLIKNSNIEKNDVVYLVDVVRHVCEEFDWESEEYAFPDDTKLQLVRFSDADPTREYCNYSEWVITNHVGDINSDVQDYGSFIGDDGWVYDITEGPIPAGKPAKLYIDAMWHHIYDVDFIKSQPSATEWSWDPDDPGEVFYDAWWDYIKKVRCDSKEINHI